MGGAGIGFMTLSALVVLGGIGLAAITLWLAARLGRRGRLPFRRRRSPVVRPAGESGVAEPPPEQD